MFAISADERYWSDRLMRLAVLEAKHSHGIMTDDDKLEFDWLELHVKAMRPTVPLDAVRKSA